MKPPLTDQQWAAIDDWIISLGGQVDKWEGSQWVEVDSEVARAISAMRDRLDYMEVE